MIYLCKKQEKYDYVVRISLTDDRSLNDYLAEVEFVNYLASHHANVVDVIPSINGQLVEMINNSGKNIYISVFKYAKGMLISENGYRYIEDHPLDEYFYNTGKVLGKIHHLSKQYKPIVRRVDYFDHYNNSYIEELIPEKYKRLKEAIQSKLRSFQQLPKDHSNYGLVHFDYSDGNYHIDYTNGNITVFDFDNCIYCWYMYDLANLWIHGVGWYAYESDYKMRKENMDHYFKVILEGYTSETNIEKEMLELLPVFIDMVLIENIVDEFECCRRENIEVDLEDIEEEARCLIEGIQYAGFLGDIKYE